MRVKTIEGKDSMFPKLLITEKNKGWYKLSKQYVELYKYPFELLVNTNILVDHSHTVIQTTSITDWAFSGLVICQSHIPSLSGINQATGCRQHSYIPSKHKFIFI